MSTTPTAEAPSPTVALLAKLLKVAKSIRYIEKRGQNAHHGYNYAQAVDVTRAVRDKLYRQGVLVVPGTVPGSVTHSPAIGGRGMVTTIDLVYRFTDTETGAVVEVPWTGAGADTGGDKGIYKAYTGGLKYALLSLFQIPTSDDPERDALTVRESEEVDKTSKDAERPAATRIPKDRAAAILEAAISAGLVTRDGDKPPVFGPVFKAKLADVGADKIGTLDVDQAEAVEAFIAAEKKGA